jgi:fluoride exporter
MSAVREVLDGLPWVVLGSALGGMSRFLLSGLIGRWIGETFPWGTMFVNVSGCFTIGVFGALALQAPSWFDEHLFWPLAVVGFLGAYTTVSSFSLQTLMLARDGQVLRATGNVVLSTALCLAAVMFGYTTAIQLGPVLG